MHRSPDHTSLRILVLALLFGAMPAAAATITVTTFDDEINADGDCSLREALQAANTNAPVDACAAGSPGLDTIVLPAGTIPLGVTINVTEAVTIRGAGRASTTILRGASTAFNGPGIAGATLTLQDLALVGGLNAGGPQDIAATRVDFSGAGGTIVNTLNGAITVADCTLDGDGVNSLNGNITVAGSTFTGGGINSSGGALSATDTTITGGGVNTSIGVINLVRTSVTASGSNGVNSSSGAVTLVDSAVTGSNRNGINTSSGTISLTRSLVSGSRSSGINSSSGAIVVVNSTISGNDNGINGSTSAISLDATTVTGNAEEGIDGSNPTISLVNSIVAGNGPDCGLPVTSAQFSMTSDASCGLAGPGNRPSTNPLLGPLANNGGPTLTHMLQPGSPAIDAGSNPLCQAVDQRGVARPVDGNADSIAICDMGAVEASGVAPPPAAATPVPTLSEWGLIALVVLLALAAVRALRRGRVVRN